MAIYNTAMTLRELNDLRAESQIQQQKKGRSKRQMSPIAGLQVQEARDLITLRNEQLEDLVGGSKYIYFGTFSRPRQNPRIAQARPRKPNPRVGLGLSQQTRGRVVSSQTQLKTQMGTPYNPKKQKS
jgi:hypothetical protein